MPDAIIQPTHIGEPLVARLLSGIAAGRGLAAVQCECDGINTTCAGSNLQTTLDNLAPNQSWTFAPNVQLQPLQYGSHELKFDGAHQIDCLIHSGNCGLPLEIKLGKKRLNANRVNSEFLRSCFPRCDKHGKHWMKGNMMAVFERNWPSELAGQDLCAANSGSPVLSLDWWLVVRRRIRDNWSATRPTFGSNVHIVSFESLVALFGTSSDFNALVDEMVKSDYHADWLGQP